MSRSPRREPGPEPKRLEGRDLRLPVSEMFDPLRARQLWDSLPEPCRSDHFDKKNMPDIYAPAVAERSVGGGPWTSVALNFRSLPEPMTWELAWLIHREVELGRIIHPTHFNATTGILRAATGYGGKTARSAESLLHLTPEQWLREAQRAQLRGLQRGTSNDSKALHRLRRLQDILVYPYHQGPWWQLNLWNPQLDPRVPQREHEPMSHHTANFSRLSSDWLREGAKLWLSENLENGRYSWSTIKSRLDALKWLQRHLDTVGDAGPTLTSDPSAFRPFVRGFCEMLRTHTVTTGKNKNQLLGKNPRRNIMTAIEQFYQWMFDHRDEASHTLGQPEWRLLRPEHCVLFRPEDKPRLTNKRHDDDMVLEDAVVTRIAAGAELLAKPRTEGGLGDIQAFHILMLLIRTGRRVNEILMMDFDPLIPLQRTSKSPPDTVDSADFVARLRYQQTKIESAHPASIPVDAEIVTVIRAQQQVAREHMARVGRPDQTPRYLFLRRIQNRNGTASYSMPTLHTHLAALADRLAITDSAGHPVMISKTHRFRHTAATNLLNAGVPLHVVMRYFGHVSPEMTMHYAVTLSETQEREFLRYKKVTSDGRTPGIDTSDLYDFLKLDSRADRVLPNGWCTLPPRQSCDKGNACLTCPKFVTDATHAAELSRQLEETQRLIEIRKETFAARYGTQMSEDNVWLQGRTDEVTSLNQILLAITDTADQHGIRGAGVRDQTA
jgi:integrase